jgi:predicted nucleic acid-binding protein
VKRYVIDASVAAQWLLPEPNSREALALVDNGIERIVPDLIHAEIGNILWKRVRTGDLPINRAKEVLHELEEIPLTVCPVAEFMELSLGIATEYGRSFYDSAYVALALRERAVLLTADAKLVRALGNTPLAGTLRHIAEHEI